MTAGQLRGLIQAKARKLAVLSVDFRDDDTDVLLAIPAGITELGDRGQPSLRLDTPGFELF